MKDKPTLFLPGFGGALLAVHRMGPALGAGRPVLLLHGLFSSAEVNWVKYGHAAQLAAAGCEVLMPDLRAHGQSAAPHDPTAYPPDVLLRDVAALVRAHGLDDYALGGFSLGARTALGVVAAAAEWGLPLPRRLVLGGMGLAGLGVYAPEAASPGGPENTAGKQSGWARRSAHFIDAIDRFGTIPRGDPAFVAQAFMKSMAIDRVAARLLLQSVQDIAEGALGAATMPALVVCGAEDADNGSAPDLAAALPNARYAEVLGNHMSSVTRPELGAQIAAFLAG